MATVRNEPRLRFLQNASEALQVTAPTISAHLGATRNQAIEENSGRDTSKSGCASCGARLVPGWSCFGFKDPKAKRTRKDRLAQETSTTKTVTVKCTRCGALTVQETAKRARAGRIPKTKPTTTTASSSENVGEKPPSTLIKTDTKEIMKAPQRRVRGKKSSLQSIINNQKLEPSRQAKGYGLGLQDFMKE